MYDQDTGLPVPPPPPGHRRMWEHAVETTLLTGVAVLAATAILPGKNVPGSVIPWCVAAAGVAAAFVVFSLTGRTWFSLASLAFGLWLAWWAGSAEKHFWRPGTFESWLIGMILASALSGVMASGGSRSRRRKDLHLPSHTEQEQREAEEESSLQREDREHREEMARWENLFRQVGQPVRVVDLRSERWGRYLRLELPAEGTVTRASLEGETGRIAMKVKAKSGTIEFSEGDHAGDVIMRLRETDVLGGVVHLPKELYASTIRKPFAVGVDEAGGVVKISLREIHAMIIGTTGAGKSNLINVIMAQAARCVDTLLWVIDTKSRTVKPWLQAYAEGTAERPVIDWPATTREEAAEMLQAFIRIVTARSKSGIGGSKITPSASMPQIILICDEMADLFGLNRGPKKTFQTIQAGEEVITNAQFVSWAEEIAQKGRSEALATIWASQRGTVSMSGSGDLKSLCQLMVTLGVKDENEARYAQSANSRAGRQAAALLGVKGAGVVTIGQKAELPTKFYYLDHPPKPGGEPDETLCDDGCAPTCPVYMTAVEAGHVRPGLDRISAGAAGAAYASRWQRAGDLLLRRPPAAGSDPVDISSFDDIVSGIEPEDAGRNPQRIRMMEILAAQRRFGMTPKRLYESLLSEHGEQTVTREVLQRWLRAEEAEGTVYNPAHGLWVIGPKPEEKAPED